MLFKLTRFASPLQGFERIFEERVGLREFAPFGKCDRLLADNQSPLPNGGRCADGRRGWSRIWKLSLSGYNQRSCAAVAMRDGSLISKLKARQNDQNSSTSS